MKPCILALTLVFAGCASNTPVCGPNVTTACTNPWWTMLEGVQPQPQGRDYSQDPIQLPVNPSSWQPIPNSYSSQHNGTQRFMLNTPNGIQYRTCRNLAGGNAYCF